VTVCLAVSVMNLFAAYSGASLTPNTFQLARQPLKLALVIGASRSLSNTWFLGTTHTPIGIKIYSAVFCRWLETWQTYRQTDMQTMLLHLQQQTASYVLSDAMWPNNSKYYQCQNSRCCCHDNSLCRSSHSSFDERRL